MTYVLYNKPYKTPADLIVHMQNKGLQINNIPDAEKLLSFINYYRFKIYLFPFLDHSTSRYHQGTVLENGIQLYRFDDELRGVLFSVIGRIEIKLRTRLDQVVTSHTNNPFWYLKDTLFMKSNLSQMNSFRSSLAAAFQQSKAEFCAHYKKYYFNDTNSNFKQLPPFWTLAELTTFGNVKTLYSSLDKSQFQGGQNSNKLNSLAHEFGATNLAQLNNWINLIRDVRNRCAHHSRVWNCNYPEPKNISPLLSIPAAHQNRLYLFVAMLHKIDKTLALSIDVKDPLLQLFNKYPAANNLKHSMGFPNSWETDQFWH
ncbi:MAG: Abi family protein [Acinetobacter sp.]|nr:MAG: Abi family protein [Acinetobacter sp.]